MSEPIDVFPNGQVPINVTPAQLVPIIINQGGSDPELEQKVAENTAKIAEHEQEISNINTQVTLLSNELAEQEQEIIDINADVVTNTQQITAINMELVDINTQLSSQETQIATNTQDITAIKTDISVIETVLEQHTIRMSDIEADVSALDTDVNNLSTQVATNTQGITDVNAELDSVSLQVNTNTQAIVSINTELDNVAKLDEVNTFLVDQHFDSEIITKVIAVGREVSPTIAIVNGTDNLAVRATMDNSGYYLQNVPTNDYVGGFYNNLLRIPINGQEMYTGEGDKVWHSGDGDLTNKVNKTGDTMTGALELPFMVLNGGSSVARLFAGNIQDHVFVEFFADSQNQAVRSGYLGYGTPGNGTFTIHNQMDGGDFDLRTTGTGKLYHNGSDIWTSLNNLASLGGNGWQRLASGLIIQWGSLAVPNGTVQNVVFPMAFPSFCRSVQATTNTTTSHIICSVGAIASGSFNVIQSDSVARAVTWLAIGY